MSVSETRRASIAMVLAGLGLLAGIWLVLLALPDRGIGARTALAPPNAPEIAPASAANARGHEILGWAVAGIALAFEEADPFDTQVRLEIVASPSVARSVAARYGDSLRRFGFAAPGTELHDIELTGFSQTQRQGEIEADVSWVTLALRPGDAHDHEIGAAFRARVTLSRGPAQWRVTAFDLLAPE